MMKAELLLPWSRWGFRQPISREDKLGHRFAKLVLIALMAALSASAAEIALLRNGFSIRHDRRETMEQHTRLFAGTNWVDVPTAEIDSFTHEPDSSPLAPVPKPDVSQVVSAASEKHLIDRDLISSVIRAESGFNERAVSPKGAQGLMQLMPGTALSLGVRDAFDASANVEAGTRYLRELLMMYKGDLIKALAAYNAGPKRVDQYKGVPPYRETRAYVSRIIRDFNRKKLADKEASPATDQHSAKRAAQTDHATAGAGSQP
jgi:soluble lytic murein transglycosylase-like protein